MRSIPWLVGLAALALATPVLAGNDNVSLKDDAPEISTDVDDLVATLRPDIEDPDSIDTVLTFTNLGRRDTYVVCRGFDHDGHRIGHAKLKLPALGVRYFAASRLSQDVDFVGHVQCATRGPVAGGAVLLVPGGISDLEVIQGNGNQGHRIKFPLVVHR